MKRLSDRKARKRTQFASVVLLIPPLLLGGCAITTVSPYDEKLVDQTDTFYREASKMVAKGRSVSPTRNEDRAAIRVPSEHAGHFSAFKSSYDALVLDTDALILRAMSGAGAIDSTGEALQERLTQAINEVVPSRCGELYEELGKVSLTTAEFVELKCLILGWREHHDNLPDTQGTRILKKANWEGRQLSLFNGVLAVQQAERFKKEPGK